jgi:hypothetical protein
MATLIVPARLAVVHPSASLTGGGEALVRLRLDELRYGLDEGQVGEGLREVPRCGPVVVSISSA